MSDIRDYQVDHLLLLVGSNPLPNAVAGRLLVRAGGLITLIHSKDTYSLAGRLESWLKSAGDSGTPIARIDLAEVKESDADSVYRRVNKVLKDYESKAKQAERVRVGLNYTGGTKVMSVHAYRALENWVRPAENQRQEREAIFSYLDAHTLCMHIEGIPGKDTLSYPVSLEVEIGIEALLKMHGWEWHRDRKGEPQKPVTTPVLPGSAAALLTVHSNPDGAKKIWTEWLSQEFFPATRKRVLVRRPFWVFQAEQELQGLYDVKQPAQNDNWMKETQLQESVIQWPNLPALCETMRKELEQSDPEKLHLKVEKASSFECAVDFWKWLSGTWLESVVLSTLQNCSKEMQLQDCCMNLRITIPAKDKKKENEGEFEFDVIAIRGYQLFAFSCTTDSSTGLLKQKLFELYIRARQMGGDEACAALACCVEQREVDKLEQQVRREINQERGRIRVFGREQLANLSQNIENWMSEQSKED